ncbi:MAG: hypothetical protein PWQ93_161 [Clostridiales bacterium]|nr:hypothetical protein [Clostridiales bacterium]
MDVLASFKLNSKKAIVTGAAQGLGRAMAEALAQAGADVVIADINMENADAAARELQRFGTDIVPIKVDVTDRAQVQQMIDNVSKRWGRLDIFVNNAGIVRNVPAEEMSEEDWHDVINLNLNAVFTCSQIAGRMMIRQNGGVIINIASMSGIIVNNPQPQASYNVSKAGVIMLTKSLAAEWAKYNIRVNAIAPGYMRTSMTEENLKTDMAKQYWLGLTPMQRAGLPEELGGAVVYLASDASSFMTGHTMVIDGGYTVW